MKILIAGDFCPKERISKLIDQDQFDSIFHEVQALTRECNYSIVNLECPVIGSMSSTIIKDGPSLNCTEKAIKAIKYAGFNCVTLANNHFYDHGEKGVRETLMALDNNKVAYVGGGTSLDDASRTLYQRIGEKMLAIVNCCEHEFSIATATTGGSNPLNPVKQFYAINEAKKKADYVIVIVHGGIEHYQLPSPRMVSTYRFFIDAGADAVVNHHQHCFSGFEKWNGKPIFYGLGNFCFDWNSKRTKLWDEGFMLQLILSDSIRFELYPYSQNGDEIGVSLLEGNDYIEWKKRFDELTQIISDENRLNEAYKELINRTERLYSANLTPYSNRITLSLYMRHLLPMLLSKKKIRTLLNMLRCESHYDRMICMLENYSR